MTVLEFWGCSLITFGPALAMFTLTVARDPIKVILLVSSSFYWLISFLMVAICWALINSFCDYLIIGAYLAVLSQEAFRYLFHISTKRAQVYLSNMIGMEQEESTRRPKPPSSSSSTSATAVAPESSASRRRRRSENEQIQLVTSSELSQFQDRIPMSYVSGLGFGLMNGAFSLMNVLTDYIGPGTVGLKGDSTYFLLVSSLTALAFILLNVAWSILMSESIEKQDKKLAMVVLFTHLMATTVTFINKYHLQLISIIVIYSLTLICGLGAMQVAGLNPRRLLVASSSSPISTSTRTTMASARASASSQTQRGPVTST